MSQYILKRHGNKKFSTLPAVIIFLEKNDPALLAELHNKEITVSQYIFNLKNNKDPFNKYGKSIISGKETDWNEKSGKYNRIREEEKDQYRQMFRERMLKIHKTDNLLNDVEMQKKMLANRSISGKYRFQKGKEFPYTGSYERDFLEVMDLVFDWDPNDLLLPAPMTFEYTDKEGKDHFYIPDVFIISLQLIIEIKASDNKHYRERDIELEMSKDAIVEKSEYRFLKIFDKNYSEFIRVVHSLRSENLMS